jgi:ABC-2 type transport system permease protein
MSSVPTQSWVMPAVALWQREVQRFLRQRSRVVGALATPVVFWVLVGSGFGRSFRGGDASEMNYLEYAYPGTIAMILLFTAIFSTISIIEDRREGFLQAVVAAPVHRSAIAFGKIMGSTTLAVFQAVLFLCLAPLAGVPISFFPVLAMVGACVIVAIGLSGLGVMIAWPMESTQGFHAIMNLFLLPMWLLSGALFPSSGASPWLGWVMALNPLTYGVSAIRGTLYYGQEGALAGGPSLVTALLVSIAFAFVMTVAATMIVGRKR